MQTFCGVPDTGALHAFRKAKAASYAVLITGPLALVAHKLRCHANSEPH